MNLFHASYVRQKRESLCAKDNYEKTGNFANWWLFHSRAAMPVLLVQKQGHVLLFIWPNFNPNSFVSEDPIGCSLN